MKPFQNATELRKKIEQLRAERNRHHTKYLYGGSNVYWKAKKKLGELNKEIYRLEKKKEQIANQQPRLL